MSFLRNAWCCCRQQEIDQSSELDVGLEKFAVGRESESMETDTMTRQLWRAAANGNAQEVEDLLLAGADVNGSDPESTPSSRNITPLIHAARAGHRDVVSILLKDPSLHVNSFTMNETIPVRSRQAALHWACRQGKADVVAELLCHKDLDVNMKTQLGYTALQVACQCGHCDVVRLLTEDKRTDMMFFWVSPSHVEIDAMKVAIFEGFADVVKVLVSTRRKDVPDLNHLSMGLAYKANPIGTAATAGHPAIVRILLEARSDPSIQTDTGKDSLAIAADADSTEIVQCLLSAGMPVGNSFSELREAQILGQAKELCQLYGKKAHEKPGEIMPSLHMAVLDNDEERIHSVIKEVVAGGGQAYDVEDGGRLPAVYWAIELGRWNLVKALLTEGHGMDADFVTKLLNDAFGTIHKGPAAQPGERVFEVVQALLAQNTAITADRKKAKGAFKLLHPFCASVIALKYLQAHMHHFIWLRETCHQRSAEIYSRIDAEVGTATLQKLALVGADENQEGTRQDDEGLLPKFEYIANVKSGQRMAGNHELYAARSIALAAMCIQQIFMQDMRALFDTGFPGTTLHAAPPKTFSRMYNKLNNKHEHGDPSIPKPRPMKNVDVNRFAMSVTDPADVERVLLAIKSKYKILRVKNSHDPGTGGYGAYRSLLINFAYDTGVSCIELFGSGHYDDTMVSKGKSDIDEAYIASDATGQVWSNYCRHLRPAFDWLWGLQGLWSSTRIEPHRTFTIAAEVQVILEPYMRGRELSHLLYKISRCETGPSEMARDFASSFQDESEVLKGKKAAVLDIASKARQAKAA
mmetsp:Transcript_12277/g.27877  ORF Transcript_12277/g.27877 Transcript_12277/m.27877 type:complete len:807 (+) Transcript_12277:73-2493(+)